MYFPRTHFLYSHLLLRYPEDSQPPTSQVARQATEKTIAKTTDYRQSIRALQRVWVIGLMGTQKVETLPCYIAY